MHPCPAGSVATPNKQTPHGLGRPIADKLQKSAAFGNDLSAARRAVQYAGHAALSGAAGQIWLATACAPLYFNALSRSGGSLSMSHAETYLKEVVETAQKLSVADIETLCDELVALRERDGRLFFLGVGGSAGNCGHAVNDFRKLCGIETYAPTDNVSELTARTNDEGWHTVFSEWLKVSRANAKDAIFIFSVGGGNLEKNVSPNLVAAIQEAKTRNMKVFGIVGRDGGYTKKAGDVVVIVPTTHDGRVTPHAEEFQGVVWHCLVSHPKLQKNATKW
ncbi:MAG TPA: SIS domain-containing protein [Pseudolabrys sp.]|nr:SIS domain-containing protein [Pseudolabrys sp.]